MNLKKILDYIPGYGVVRTRNRPDGGGLAHANTETKDENGLTTQSQANWSTADIRDFLRNTSFGQAILNQLQVNVVGTVGGRLAFATNDDEFNARANREWARYAKSCGLYGGSSLNKILRDVVGCLHFNGGDALLVFDDGRLTGGRGTGKVYLFESDQIANAPEAYFRKNFPEGWTQERGMIFNRLHIPVGFFASAKRGKAELPLGPNGKPQFLTFVDRHPDLDPERRPFHFVSRTWRPNQGRGVPTIIHVINELRNLEDLQAFETQAAKLNSSLGLAIKEDASAQDAALADALINNRKPAAGRVKFDPVLRQQSAILQLPKGKDIVSFDTKRPNERVIDFIDANKSLIVAAFGLGRQFYTLTPEASFTAHRGAMQMAWQSIRQTQSDLEGVCNWLASQWFYWRRTADVDALPVTDAILADIDFSVEWSWPEMPEVDSAKHEATKTASLQNGTKTFRDLIGPEWRRKVEERAIEREFFQERGEVYPGDRMATGGVVDNSAISEDTEHGKQ